MDTLTPDERSERMSRVRAKDTGPELIVRRAVWRLGFRYRLHVPGVPGHPDVVLRRLGKVILVHGCFWHRHPGCHLTRMPKSREDFWRAKFERNVERDRQTMAALRAASWDVLTVWECETTDEAMLSRKLTEFLGPLR